MATKAVTSPAGRGELSVAGKEEKKEDAKGPEK